jgi:cardiolipin synthase
MLAAIGLATRSVCLEMYIFGRGSLGEDFREALVHAAERGVRVRLLLDALGCGAVDEAYWRTLVRLGGEVRWFHRFHSALALVRDHRKLLVCDAEVAIVCGWNIAGEYDGDGIETGWRDCGVVLAGQPARALEHLFDEQFESAARRQPISTRLRRRAAQSVAECGDRVKLLPVTPGRGLSCLTESLLSDLDLAMRQGGEVTWVSPYFLPTGVLRRAMRRAVRPGRMELTVIVPEKTDVRLSRLASQRLYTGLMGAGIRILEYQPQVLHAKILLFPHAVYVGSSNLDPRSLHLNYELMVRLTGNEAMAQARADVADMRNRSRVLDRADWMHSRTWLQRLREQWAYWVLYRIDPWVTSRAAGPVRG